MKVAVVGGGPGGLFFAYLLKKARPDHEVILFERNAEGATYGWGVVFSNTAMRFLQDTDPAFYERFVADHHPCDYLEIILEDVRVQLTNNHFSRTSRADLLSTMIAACREAGVELRFETTITGAAELAGFDVIVGADGAHSAIRNSLTDQFGPSIAERRNYFAWYGTRQLFHPVSLIFRNSPHGAFIAHSYQYNDELSTFLIEASPEAWHSAGLDRMSDEDSRAFCEQIFAKDLGANPLLSNRSTWFRARIVEPGRWSVGNVVLIGDALRTVHFSLGSGTRMALQDAVALFEAFRAEPVIEAAFARFEASRRGASDQFQYAASRSLDWYETVDTRLNLDPLTFAHSYMRRTGRVSDAQLDERNPHFMRAYRSARGASAATMSAVA
jgi:anthraniloyl-CoA monooxygenase